MKHKTGFTLSEVLITLGIIGIVAAMTLPTLIQKQQEKIAVVRLKSIYSILDQTVKQAVLANGTVDQWGIINGTEEENLNSGAVAIYKNIKPFIKQIQECNVKNLKNPCFADSYTNLYGNNYTLPYANGMAFRFANGASVLMYTNYQGCTKYADNLCAYMFVDVNGNHKPNKLGKDLFLFIMKRNSVSPTGKSTKVEHGGDFYSFEKYCADNKDGAGCTAWVIFNENMDYLHCNGLSWNGKTKCK